MEIDVSDVPALEFSIKSSRRQRLRYGKCLFNPCETQAFTLQKSIIRYPPQSALCYSNFHYNFYMNKMYEKNFIQKKFHIIFHSQSSLSFRSEQREKRASFCTIRVDYDSNRDFSQREFDSRPQIPLGHIGARTMGQRHPGKWFEVR